MKTLTAVVVTLMSLQAFAQGVLISPAQLPPDARRQLSFQIDAARKSDAASFEALAQLRQKLGALDAQKRGRQAPISPALRQLGPKALYPMIQEAAFSAPPRGDLKNTAWQAWKLGLLEV